MINKFKNKYYFLSNFYERPIYVYDYLFGSNETAFQAMKNIEETLNILKKYNANCKNINNIKSFENLSPSEAKKIGRRVTLRSDWESVKYQIMYEIIKAKFTQHEDLKKKLLETGDQYLEEGNTWGDYIWGTVNGKGENNLGIILMKVREELQSCE